MSQKSRNASLVFIFITILIDVIGFGIVIPVFPKLVEGFVGNDISLTSKYIGALTAIYAVMQFFFSPIIGGLSDQYGRRPVILAALFVFFLDYLLLAYAPSLTWLFVGRIIAGITGASFTSANAYIADISTHENRAQNFGMVGAAFGIGFIIGPALGGFLANYGERFPFFASAFINLLNWLYGYFILPESLAKENRRKFDWKRANPFNSLANLAKYPVLGGLATAMFFLYVAGQVHPSTWAVFTMKEFNWSPSEIGMSLAWVGLMMAFVQGFLTRKIVPKLGEKRSVLLGLSFYILGFALFAFANQGWMMYAIMIPFALSGFAGPTLQGTMTKLVPANEQGQLQGALTSMISITAVIGPLLATNLFAYFTKEGNPHFPGAAFLSAALLVCIALGITIYSFPKNIE